MAKAKVTKKKVATKKVAKPAKKPKVAAITVTHGHPRSALKATKNACVREDAAGRVWVLGHEGEAIVAYRFDGPLATRFQFGTEDGWEYPVTSFSSHGDVAYLATQVDVVRIEGDVASRLPICAAGGPRCLAASATRVYAVFTRAEGSINAEIVQLVDGAWKPFAKGFDHLRSLTWFGDRLLVIENNQQKGYLYAADGSRTSELATSQSCMDVVTGATRFATLTGYALEIRGADGAEQVTVSSGTVGKLVKSNASFECGTAIANDELLLHVSDRAGNKAGHLVRYDAATGALAVHEHTARLKFPSSPSDLAIDRAGAIWLGHTTWDGKTRLLIIDPDGTTTAIPR